MIQELSKLIEEQEYKLTKNVLVKSTYANAKLVSFKGVRWRYSKIEDWQEFYVDPEVTEKFTHLQAFIGWRDVEIRFYSVIELDYKGKKEHIKVFSSSRPKKLANVDYRSQSIRFNKLNVNLTDDQAKICADQILELVKQNPNYKIDTTNLHFAIKAYLPYV